MSTISFPRNVFSPIWMERSPALAEDARAGLPAMRKVNLAGGNPLAFFRRRLASGYRLGVGAESFSSTEIVLAGRKTFRGIF
jgi:hypothetical protein